MAVTALAGICMLKSTTEWIKMESSPSDAPNTKAALELFFAPKSPEPLLT